MVGAQRQLIFMLEDLRADGEDAVDVGSVLVFFVSSSRDSSPRESLSCFPGCCAAILFSSDIGSQEERCLWNQNTDTNLT